MQRHDADDLSVDQIAENVARERADLVQTIDGLRDRLSVDALLGDALGYAKANMTPYARALDGAVRANPMAAVLAGVGVAWLVFGPRKGASPAETPLGGTKFEALSRWEDEGGPVAPLPSADLAWIAEADVLRNRASGTLARIDAAARQRLRPATEAARERAQVLADLAKATRAVMLRGLDSLTSEARDRIVAAREQAYAARLSAVRHGTKLIEDRPVMAGAISMAIGAAVGAALPRTEREDRLFGQQRDSLMAHAQEVLQQERARVAGSATRLAETVATEVKDSARQLVTEVH
jgi:ElaB/YqjD/DUF883 family membrane-anchored ribosome-binding protein